MKKIISLIAGILITIFIFSLIKDVLVKGFVESQIHNAIKVNVRIGSLRAGILRTFLTISRLIIYNPAGYKEKIMADIPEIHVDYSLRSILKRDAIYLKEARLDLKELNVIRNHDGTLNISSLRIASKKDSVEKPPETKAPQIHIDILRLRIGRAVYKDYTQDPVFVKELDLDIEEEYRDISNISELASLILRRALVKTAISDFIRAELGSIQEALTEKITGSREIFGEKAKEGIQNILKGATENILDAIYK